MSYSNSTFMFAGEPLIKTEEGFKQLAPEMGQVVTTWRELEELYFTSAYMACNENQAATARVTGVDERTVRKKLRSYGLLAGEE